MARRRYGSFGSSVLRLAALLLPFCGCKSQPASAPVAPTQREAQQITTPPRPSVVPPAFKVFHKSDTTLTLITKENATDAEVESLIWELRDAAHAGTLDKLHVSQKMIDARNPKVWFHIYRGSKCASEKYADGPPPCGGSYHAAGEYTYGSLGNRDMDSGSLLLDENHETQLWDPETTYVAKGGS